MPHAVSLRVGSKVKCQAAPALIVRLREARANQIADPEVVLDDHHDVG
jgi:hypothetical protein